MKIRPKNREDWYSALLFLPAALLLIFTAICLLAARLSPDWSPRYSESRVIWNFVGGWSLAYAAPSALLLFLVSILFAFWRDWRRAFWAAFYVAVWLTMSVLIAPIFARAREKPVLYLYPETEQVVNVKLQYDGVLLHTYPEYSDDGWNVLAKPSGELINLQTGRSHYCLFWEAMDAHEYLLDEGFLVAGEDTAAFLESTLARLGLSEREANEFIIYWLPRMEKNRFNVVSFPIDEYCRNVKLGISPGPDTLIRVFMIFKAVDSPIDIKPQRFVPVERHGFTVVEWGGTEIH